MISSRAAYSLDTTPREHDRGACLPHDGYRRLRSLLHVWQLAVTATRRPGYYEELRAVRDGVARTTPADEVIPGWSERLAAERAQHR